MSGLVKGDAYFAWIGELKKRYRATQIKAAVSVNAALLEFYWELGRDISLRYPGKKRDARFFQTLSADLQIALPDVKGLSPTNIKYSRYFYELYAAKDCRPQLVDDNGGDRTPGNAVAGVVACRPQVADDGNDLPAVVSNVLVRVPWGHHRIIIDKCGGDAAKALFYVRKTVENGWSRNVLGIEIAGNLYGRAGKAVTNFALTMPKPDSDLAQQLTKDPYVFEVQGLAEEYRETELTRAMCDNIVRLLNAMGKGFAFVGREVEVELAGEEYRIDLLFYVIPLHRYFVVEVKNTGFRPEHLGQLQGYVAACDMALNTPQENPAIGLLVCRGKNAPLAQYLLGKIDMPIGVSDYELLRKVPEDFRSQLPTVEEIEAELAHMEEDAPGRREGSEQ
jgi:predicted nuclease of restriction endonuclease-like (RecB) superfamily